MTAYVLESCRSFIILTAAPICASELPKPNGLHWLKGLCSVLSCLHAADLSWGPTCPAVGLRQRPALHGLQGFQVLCDTPAVQGHALLRTQLLHQF